jgi:hypothetical protein
LEHRLDAVPRCAPVGGGEALDVSFPYDEVLIVTKGALHDIGAPPAPETSTV